MVKEIQIILANWNPIGVPEFVAEDEYREYAFKIKADCTSYEEIYNYIQSVFTNEMGGDLTNEVITDIKNVSEKISQIIIRTK